MTTRRHITKAKVGPLRRRPALAPVGTAAPRVPLRPASALLAPPDS